jgi:hypothetical protein
LTTECLFRPDRETFMDNHTLLIIFVALTGVSVLLQAIVLIGILAAISKAAKVVTESTQDLKATILPIVHSTKDLVERLSPEVMVVTAGLAELTQVVRRETKEVHFSVSEIIRRVNTQTARLDAMLTATLDVMERTGTLLEQSIAAPVRQVNGVFAAVRAVIDTYRTTQPHRTQPRREAPRYAQPRTTETHFAAETLARSEKVPDVDRDPGI